jgi:formylglycine-generating enzyme required for sulfatase activity
MPRTWTRLSLVLLPGFAAALVGVAPGQAAPLPAAPPEITNRLGIPAGKFLMGSPDSFKAAPPDEKPQHEVTLTRAFYLGVYTVTQEEYRRVVGKNPSCFSAEGQDKEKVAGMDTGRFPVENVSWEDAVAFCARLSALLQEKQAGREYRLPTEAEWEYACRAGTTTAFWWGDSASSFQANFDGNFPDGNAEKGPFLNRPCRVGSFQSNPWGLYDLHGNVFQWCSDWSAGDYYDRGIKTDPRGPDGGNLRVMRGGCWGGNGSWDCRAAYRGAAEPGDRGARPGIGFRVACSVGPRNP